MGLVSDEGTRDVAVNPKPAINPLRSFARARARVRGSGTISRTDRMPRARRQGWPSTSSTCCTLNSRPGFRDVHGRERSSSTKHAHVTRSLAATTTGPAIQCGGWTNQLSAITSLLLFSEFPKFSSDNRDDKKVAISRARVYARGWQSRLYLSVPGIFCQK